MNFNKYYSLNSKNINDYFNSLDEGDFQNQSAMFEIEDKLREFRGQFNYNTKTLEYTDIKEKTYIHNGNLTLSGDTIVFDTLIVSGSLTVLGNNLIIKKKLIVGGNVNLHLDKNISNAEKRKIWQFTPKTVILICGELKCVTKDKESNIEFFGNTVLTVFNSVFIQGTLNISGNCYFHNRVEISKDLIARTLTLINCKRICVDGQIQLKNELKITGNVHIVLQQNNFCKT